MITDGEIIALRDANPDSTWAELADSVGLTMDAFRNRYRRIVKRENWENEIVENSDPLDEQVVIFHDKKKRKKLEWRSLAQLAIDTQEVRGDLSDTQTDAEVTIPGDQPIVVTFQGDWHLGHAAIDYKQWLKDITTILDTEGVYMVDLGDSYNNIRQFKILAAVTSQVLMPDIQAEMFRSLVEELTDNNKLLAKVDGNHDAEFDERVFGDQLQNYLLSRLRAPRFPNRGLLTLNVGKATWRLLLFHKSRFRSIINPVHGAIREYQLDYPADIVAGGHDHVPAAMIMYENMRATQVNAGFGGETFLLKVGTYQQDKSGFGYRYFHNGGIPQFFSVVFDPDQKRKYLFTDLYDAIGFRETLVAKRSPQVV